MDCYCKKQAQNENWSESKRIIVRKEGIGHEKEAYNDNLVIQHIARWMWNFQKPSGRES